MKSSVMTVHSLIAALRNLPWDAIVVLASDAEGNSYSPAFEVISGTKFPTRTTRSQSILTKDDLEEGNISEEEWNKGRECVVIWPLQ